MWGSYKLEDRERAKRLERKVDSLDSKVNRILKIDPNKIKADIIQAINDNVSDSKEDTLKRVRAAVERILPDE